MSEISRGEFLRRSLGLAIIAAIPAPVRALADVHVASEPEIWLELLDDVGRIVGAEVMPLSAGVRNATGIGYSFTVEAKEAFVAAGIRYRMEFGRLLDEEPFFSEWREAPYRSIKWLDVGDSIQTTLTVLADYDEGRQAESGPFYVPPYPSEIQEIGPTFRDEILRLLPPGTEVHS